MVAVWVGAVTEGRETTGSMPVSSVAMMRNSPSGIGYIITRRQWKYGAGRPRSGLLCSSASPRATHGQARVLTALRYRSALRYGASGVLCKQSHSPLPSASDPNHEYEYTAFDIRETHVPLYTRMGQKLLLQLQQIEPVLCTARLEVDPARNSCMNVTTFDISCLSADSSGVCPSTALRSSG